MSSAPAAPPAALPAGDTRLQLRDFPDIITPMLVRELRQGLKSHVFTWGLMAMQTSLILITVFSLLDEPTRGVHTAFWWSVAAPLFILLPIRTANALREETSSNTLDTLLLTRLSAWRITLGKWLANCGLQILVSITALPYLILRYFFGGVNTPLEIAWLGTFLLLGMVASAIMVGLSWFPYFIVRALVLIGLLFGAGGWSGAIIDDISRGDYMLDEIVLEIRWSGALVLVLAAGYLSFFFLDLGAARLAPLAENRSTRRRLMGLSLLFLGGACCLALWYAPPGSGRFPADPRAIASALGAFLCMAMVLPMVQALSERPVNLAPILMPFMKRGRRGRFAAHFLLPGWHTGIFYSAFILCLISGLAVWGVYEYHSSSGRPLSIRKERDTYYALGYVLAIPAILTMPVVLWRATSRMNRWNFWRWLLLTVAAGAFHVFFLAMGQKVSQKFLYVNYLLPSGSTLTQEISRRLADTWVTETIPPLPADRRTELDSRLRSGRISQETDIARVSFQARHSVIAGISCVLWLGVAGFIAFREMRATRQAWRDQL